MNVCKLRTVGEIESVLIGYERNVKVSFVPVKDGEETYHKSDNGNLVIGVKIDEP